MLPRFGKQYLEEKKFTQSKNDFNNEKTDRFVQEVFAAYSLKESLQLTTYYSGNFEDKVHTVSVGLTVFL